MKWYREKLDEIGKKQPIYSCCGDDCAVCPRFLPASEEELRQTAQFWYEVGWRDHIVSGDEIRCGGCGTRQGCTYMLLPCMKEHVVSKCGDCELYPCEKMKDMLKRTGMKAGECRAHCTDEAEWKMLKRAFYEKEKNLD